MGVNGRNSRDNLVQIEIKGRNQPTNRNKKSNTVYRIKKSEPIRYIHWKNLSKSRGKLRAVTNIKY